MPVIPVMVSLRFCRGDTVVIVFVIVFDDPAARSPGLSDNGVGGGRSGGTGGHGGRIRREGGADTGGARRGRGGSATGVVLVVTVLQHQHGKMKKKK